VNQSIKPERRVERKKNVIPIPFISLLKFLPSEKYPTGNFENPKHSVEQVKEESPF
jgi:hypothetical protein